MNQGHPALNPIEQLRLILAAALVATAVATIQVLPEMPDAQLQLFVKGVLAISVVSGFLYLLLTAASLKFSKSDEVGNWPFTERFRQRCYDYCIDSCGVQIISIIMFGCAYALGWSFQKDVWDWRVGVGALVSLLLSGFVRYIVRYRR